MKREEYVRSCINLLNKLCDLVEMRNSLNYYDINISCEFFFIPLLNRIFDCDLHNINAEKKNAAAIDLYDSNGKIAIQVTSDSSAKKIHKTVNKYRESGLYKKYNRLVIVVITKSHDYKADFTSDTNGEFRFSSKDDIFTIKELINAISNLDITTIQDVYQYLEYQLGTVLDEIQVLSIEKSFDYISRNTNYYINENYFEVDDERFISDFQKKLAESDIIHIVSLSEEEGRYCILYLLKRFKPDTPVYVIKSPKAWTEAENQFSECILIPDFYYDEIPAIKNNKTIFISNKKSNHNTITLHRRTLRFLTKKLEDNGYDNSYNLVRRTKGYFYYIKSALFTGARKLPCWENDYDHAVITAILLGGWTECDQDKNIIETIYGKKYEDLISYLNKYMGNEDPLIICKQYSVCIYGVTDPYLALCSHTNIKNYPIINLFFEKAYEIITNKNDYGYSKTLINGVLCTLIILAVEHDMQGRVSHLIRTILSEIKTVKGWEYISQYYELLCEASPDVALECLENNLNNLTGLLEVFSFDNMIGAYNYTHILWGLEELLSCKEYAVRSTQLLLKLGNKIEKCALGNNPRDDVSKIFCTWYNISVLSVEQKIDIASDAINKYPYFWDILYNEINGIYSISTNPAFLFRVSEVISQYTNIEKNTLICEYTKMMICAIGNNIDRLTKALELLPICTDEVFFEIQKHLLGLMDTLSDPEREKIKTSLRKYIYKHRYFASTDWAASLERINKIELIFKGIKFRDLAYDFIYLANNTNDILLEPYLFESEDDYRAKNKLAIEKLLFEEFSRMKSSEINLSHYLDLINTDQYSILGKMIAKYYCGSKYDINVLDTILSANKTRIAADYLLAVAGSGLHDIYKVIEYIKLKRDYEEVYIEVLAVLPLNEKNMQYVEELSDKAKEYYWRRFSINAISDTKYLNYIVDNLSEYNNLNMLYMVLYEYSTKFSIVDILTILDKTVKKVLESNYGKNSLIRYYINQIISNIDQRIGNDFDVYPIIYDIELQLSDIIDWDNMKCSLYYYKNDANRYANLLISLTNSKSNRDKYRQLYSHYDNIKFCLGEVNGDISRDILYSWINTLKNRLEEQGLLNLFMFVLGHLFSYSPKVKMGLFHMST